MNALQIISNYLVLHWPAILSLLGGGAGISLILEYVTHKAHIDSKKVAFTLLHLITLVTTVAAYFLANLPAHSTLPFYGTIVIFAETWHRFVLSPAYNKVVVPYLQYLENNKPKTGVPVVPVATTPDFPA
jgi:hypothetical protein